MIEIKEVLRVPTIGGGETVLEIDGQYYTCRQTPKLLEQPLKDYLIRKLQSIKWLVNDYKRDCAGRRQAIENQAKIENLIEEFGHQS